MRASEPERKQFSSAKRDRRGHNIAELGPTLMIAFAMLIFPLLALGFLGTRYLLLINAANVAAEQASKSATFKTDTSTSYSAVTTANNVSQQQISGIGGGAVQWVATQTYIYVCPLGTTTVTTPGANTPLTAAANSSANTYNCVVKVNAVLQPLFPGWKGMIGSIPGLNTSISTWAQASRFFENTSNLNE